MLSLSNGFNIALALLHDPEIPLLGTPKRVNNRHSNKMLYTNVYNSTIHNRRSTETTQMSIYRRMDKAGFIHTIKYSCDMHELWECYTKWNKPDGGGHVVCDFTHVKYVDETVSRFPGGGGGGSERLLLNLKKTLRFFASRGEEFNPGPETRLDYSELLCNKVNKV